MNGKSSEESPGSKENSGEHTSAALVVVDGSTPAGVDSLFDRDNENV